MMALAALVVGTGLIVTGVALLAPAGCAILVAGALLTAFGAALGRDRGTSRPDAAQLTRG